ncbi:MAG: hypothetical protein HY010_02435 [Acidobacteria bacterium]|nr:hypothetical protein [Acidobacteriota bacterium]
MEHRHAKGAFAIFTGLFLLVSYLHAQSPAQPVHNGVVQDWTQHHIVFSRSALLKNPSLVSAEPRIANQVVTRWQHARTGISGLVPSPSGSKPQRDWNVSLGLGRIAPNMFPAKFSFDPQAAPDCTNDYVVFGLNRVGANGGQANLVAFNNLYSDAVVPGICGLAPTVLFAYNISTVAAGRILDSPALSRDGTKIAFVESGAGSSTFHVLTWTPGTGAIAAAAAPGGAMTSLVYAAALNTRSSPWIDYNTDTAYVGSDDGKLYKILTVFTGTPTLAGAPWPVTLATNVRVSSPVLDKTLGLVMVGNQSGTFFSVDATTGAVKSLVVGRSGGTNPGILAAPVVDVTNGTSFVVSSNDGTSGVFVEVNSETMTQLAKGQIGQASHSGTAISLFQPAFDDAYFNDPTTGTVRLCGTGAADNTPWQYAFGGFTLQSGKFVMNTTPTFSAQLLTSTTARCTAWTEFFNTNLNGGTDLFFFGLTADCSGAGTSGCVAVRNGDGTISTANVTGGPSGIVIDNDSGDAQASSLYFTGAAAPNLAIKLTQNGLQ